MRPVLRYSYERGAYVLRLVGENHGPVLRKNRRREKGGYLGTERRAAVVTALLVDPVATTRPSGGVRVLGPAPAVAKRVGPAQAVAKRSDATPRRRQHGRQRPPRPRH